MSFLSLFSRSHRRRQRARRRLAVTVVTLLGLGAMAMAATAYSRLYVFGESLTGVGNLLAAAGLGTGPAPSGTFDGTFGPGNPVWAEDLAAHLGLQANAWTSGGAALDAGMDGILPQGFSLPSLAAQIQGYLAGNGGAADPGGLFVIQGANAPAAGALLASLGANAGNIITGGGESPSAAFSGPSFATGGPPAVTNPLPFIFVPSGPSDPIDPEDVIDQESQQVCLDCAPPTYTPPCAQEPCGPPIVLASLCAVEPCTPVPPDCQQDCGPTQPNQQVRSNDIPEPGTVAMVAAGLTLLLLVRQRRPAWVRRARRG